MTTRLAPLPAAFADVAPLPATLAEAVTGRLLLAIDTATAHAALALGDGRDAPRAARSWRAGYRHGEELLANLDEVLADAGATLEDVGGIVAGTGPGTFTGLRVGLATAKGLAYGLRVPIVGVSTTCALAWAAWHGEEATEATELVVVLPAGPHDRYVARYRHVDGAARPAALDEARLLPAGASADDVAGPRAAAPAAVLAVDTAAPSALVDAGYAVVADAGRAAAELGRALLALGRVAFEEGRTDDVAELVPAYVTLPRGITEHVSEISWSRDLR